MTSMLFVFRVDASLQMGSGHVMRCLTLADALTAQGAQCHFVCREFVGNLLALIRQRGYTADAVPAPIEPTQVAAPEGDKNDSAQRNLYEGWLGISWQKDAAQTRVIVEKLKPDWLVVDHYGLDRRWEAALRPRCKKLMVIDDLADRVHQCDWLLDQNLGRIPQDYVSLVPAQCKVLAGPQYALLRPEFAALRAYSLQRRQQPVLKQLLVTMGGVDLPNATGKVLQALKDCALPQDCRISVVMGPQAPWLAHIRVQAQDMPWPTEVLVNISDMAQHMADSDFAIGAAGSTSWERCSLGLPTLMVVLADNQRRAAQALQVAQAAHLIDDLSNIAMQLPIVINAPALRHRLQQMSTAAAAVTDGRGADEVLQALRVLND